MTDQLEEQQRQVDIPSEEEFVGKVRELEQERAQAASYIEEQQEAADARERDIERMRVCMILHLAVFPSTDCTVLFCTVRCRFAGR